MPFWTKLYSNHANLTGFSTIRMKKFYFKILKNYLQFSEIFVTPFLRQLYLYQLLNYRMLEGT